MDSSDELDEIEDKITQYGLAQLTLLKNSKGLDIPFEPVGR